MGTHTDGTRWIACANDFFLPVRILSRVFRGKFLGGLRAAFAQGQLRFSGSLAGLTEADGFERVLAASTQTDWVVYAKRPFGGPERVLKYLARYTHRVAISNRRLVDFNEGQVHFRYKDYAHGGSQRIMTLSANEFVRRLLLHVLPSGFVRIRHYGLLANRHRHEKLALCRELLDVSPKDELEPRSTGKTETPERPSLITPTRVCPICGAGRMTVVEEFPPLTVARDRPEWSGRPVAVDHPEWSGRPVVVDSS